MTHPIDAFHFRSIAGSGIRPSAAGSNLRRFAGVAYSGDALSHPYWGRVAFDLASTVAPNPTPILLNHDRDQRAGFATLRISDHAIEIADGTLMMDTDPARKIAAESDAGFPWQMSVHIEPATIDEIKVGVSVTVNGRTVSGPATIFRNSLIREVSFTPTGVDANTSATAMASGGCRAYSSTPKDEPLSLREIYAAHNAPVERREPPQPSAPKSLGELATFVYATHNRKLKGSSHG